jgi:hypothetical protein
VKLFEDKPRDHMAPKANGEHPLAYADRSGTPEAARVREFLERAFSYYPADRQAELVARLQSEGYRSGSFELMLHELLRLRGFAREVEAAKAATTKRPDFLVGNGADSFYVEAVIASEETAERVAERKRFGLLVDQINGALQSDNFFVNAEVESWGRAQPSAKSIRGFLANNLKGLAPDDVGISNTEWEWEDDGGWRITWSPMPKRVGARGRTGVRSVGIISERMLPIDPAKAIRGAVKEKASRYGTMDRPYIIAVNLVGGGLQDLDCIDALFGTFASVEVPGGGLRHIHERDGALRPDKNTRVSAIVFFDNAGFWNIAKTDAFVLHNPYAARPFPLGRLGIPDARHVGGDVLERQGGKTPIGELFGLPVGWPHK